MKLKQKCISLDWLTTLNTNSNKFVLIPIEYLSVRYFYDPGKKQIYFLLVLFTWYILYYFINHRKYLHVVLCAGLSLQNGQVRYNQASMNGQYPVGTTASFSCGSGYKLRGQNSRSCQATGTWTQTTPECERSKRNLLFKQWIF